MFTLYVTVLETLPRLLRTVLYSFTMNRLNGKKILATPFIVVI